MEITSECKHAFFCPFTVMQSTPTSNTASLHSLKEVVGSEVVCQCDVQETHF